MPTPDPFRPDPFRPDPFRPDPFRQAAGHLALSSDPAAVRRRIEALEQVLEGLVTLPVLRRRVGLDAILGLVPGVGDLVSAGLGLYLVWEARNLGMSRLQIWRMMGNVGIDTAIGAIPLAGDLFDLFYRSNTRNLAILRKHLDRHHPASRVIEG